MCGCHEWICGSAEEGPGDDCENDVELKIMEDEEPEFGESRLTKSGDFRFRFSRCSKPGYHIKGRSYHGKSQCFCAGNGFAILCIEAKMRESLTAALSCFAARAIRF